jgi:hypothetical protein
MSRFFRHIRSNAIAYTALFVALSGTAVAASSAVKRNSVGTTQLKNRAVTGAKVALHTLTGANVALHTLTGANVAKSTLTGYNIKSLTLGIVPNSARLGGLGSAAYQRTITGRCPAGHAVQSVARTGRIICQPTGTVTGVTAGTGLTGGGSSGNVSVAVDPSFVQARITDSCAAGRSMSSVKQDGTVGCHTSDVTQLMGGTGTATLSITSAYLVPTGVSAPTATRVAAEVGSADAPSTAKNLFVRVGTAPPSGGSYTFEFSLNGKDQATLKCVIGAGATTCHNNGSVPIPRGARVALHETATGITTGSTATYGWTDTTF